MGSGDLSSEKHHSHFGRFIGTSRAMQNIYALIEKAAISDAPVFITGESGTGKEICAEMLHFYSDRRNKKFIPFNCASLPQNLVESALFGHIKGAFTGADTARKGVINEAEGGTLFLDEICDMPLDTQTKLLRFTQEYHYRKLGADKIDKANIRLICATNHDPISQIQNKQFREDLYYRLHVIPIEIPPLRERNGDIIDLAYHYLHKYSAQENKKFKSFTDNAKHFILRYSWPGNVRELQNTLRQIVTLHDGMLVTYSMLPKEIHQTAQREQSSFPEITLPLWKIEKQAIEKAIHFFDGNIQKAAAMLDISPSTIYRKKQFWDKKS